VSAVLRILPDTKQPNLVLQLPLGVNLPKGVTIQIGGGGAKAVPFQSCNLNGCMAEYPITEAEIASLQKGANLMLSVVTVQNAPIKFNLPAAGFAAAYAKIKSP
jgi:invasion protein IalB